MYLFEHILERFSKPDAIKKNGRQPNIEYKEKIVKNRLDKITAIINDPKNPIFPLAEKIKQLREAADSAKEQADNLTPELREIIDNQIFDEKDKAVTRVVNLSGQLEIVAKKQAVYSNNIKPEEYEEIIAKLLPLVSKNLKKALEMYQEIRKQYEKIPTVSTNGTITIKRKEPVEEAFDSIKNAFKTIMDFLFRTFDSVSKEIDTVIENL